MDWDECLPTYTVQRRFVHSTARNAYFLGGVGTGKTVALCDRAILLPQAMPRVPHAVFGRTGRDLRDVVIPKFMERLDLFEHTSGLSLMANWRPSDNKVVWRNGAETLFRPCEQVDRYRGLSLGSAGIDELEFVQGDSLYAFQVLNTRIREGDTNLRSLYIACSPNGLRGVAAHFLESIGATPQELAAGDFLGGGGYEIHRATMFDNPFLFDTRDGSPVLCEACHGAGCGVCGGVGLSSEYIRTQRAGMSARQWRQEGLGEVLLPLSAVFGDSYSPDLHDIAWDWDTRFPWGLFVDWGEAQGAYFCAVQFVTEPVQLDDGRVLEAGSWVVAAEGRMDMVSRNQFRRAIMAFVDEGKLPTGQRLWCGAPSRPFWIATDRAVRDENYWIHRQYGSKYTRVRSCDSREQQRIRYGIGMLDYMLAPHEGPPRLYFSRSLLGQRDKTVGLRRSMLEHSYVIDRRTNQPTEVFEDDTYKHAIDALRYGIVTAAREPQVHGGAPLPYIDRYAAEAA